MKNMKKLIMLCVCGLLTSCALSLNAVAIDQAALRRLGIDKNQLIGIAKDLDAAVEAARYNMMLSITSSTGGFSNGERKPSEALVDLISSKNAEAYHFIYQIFPSMNELLLANATHLGIKNPSKMLADATIKELEAFKNGDLTEVDMMEKIKANSGLIKQFKSKYRNIVNLVEEMRTPKPLFGSQDEFYLKNPRLDSR